MPLEALQNNALRDFFSVKTGFDQSDIIWYHSIDKKDVVWLKLIRLD